MMMMMMIVLLFGLDGTPFLPPRKQFVSLLPLFGCVSESKAWKTKGVFYCGGVGGGGGLKLVFCSLTPLLLSDSCDRVQFVQNIQLTAAERSECPRAGDAIRPNAHREIFI